MNTNHGFEYRDSPFCNFKETNALTNRAHAIRRNYGVSVLERIVDTLYARIACIFTEFCYANDNKVAEVR